MNYTIIFPNKEYPDFSILEENKNQSRLYKRINETTEFPNRNIILSTDFIPSEYEYVIPTTVGFDYRQLKFKLKKFPGRSTLNLFDSDVKSPNLPNIELLVGESDLNDDETYEPIVFDLDHITLTKQITFKITLNKKRFKELKDLVFSKKLDLFRCGFDFSKVENVFYYPQVIKDGLVKGIDSIEYHFRFINYKMKFTNSDKELKKLPKRFFNVSEYRGHEVFIKWKTLF